MFSSLVILKFLVLVAKLSLQAGASCPSASHKDLSNVIFDYQVDGPVFHSSITPYEDGCQLYCHTSDDCWAYSYNNQTGHCQIFEHCSSKFKLNMSSGWTTRYQTCKLANLCLYNAPVDSNGTCVCPFPLTGKDCAENIGFVKQNTGPVCFNSQGDKYGKFFMSNAGKVKNFRLVHLSGGVTVFNIYQGNWGTNLPSLFNNENLEVYIVNTARQRLYPTSDMTIYPEQYTYHYRLPGRKNMDPELVLSDFSPPLSVTAGQELRLYFAQDFKNIFETDNVGQSCADVYANYVY